MYNDYRSPNRDSWKLTYKGSELRPFAEAKYDAWTSEEKSARIEMKKMISEGQRTGTEDFKKLEAKVNQCGDEREKCLVWMESFRREPERDFTLAIADVVYFGIIVLPTVPVE